MEIKMKKLLIAWAIIAVMLSSLMPAALAQEAMKADAVLDYEKNEIIIAGTSPVGYYGRITAVIYDAALDTPSYADMVRVGEWSAAPGAEFSFTLPLGADIATAEYCILVGVNGNEPQRVELTKKIISTADAADLLAKINAADAAGLPPLLAEIAGTVGIDLGGVYENYTDEVCRLLVDIRTAAGGFSSISAAGGCFNTARAFTALRHAADAEELKAIIAENSAALGVDADSGEYAELRDTVCAAIYKRRSEITSPKAFAAIFDEAYAVAAVMSCELENMEEKLVKYQDILGISAYMTDYKKIDKIKAARYIKSKECTSAAEIAGALRSIINSLLADSSKPDSGSSSGGSSGGGGSSSGSKIVGAVPTPEPTPAAPEYNDIDEVPWAAECIKALSTIGAISGYDDGSFKGRNPVTREEFVKIIISAFSLFDESAECDFADVTKDSWAYRYIASAYAREIISGVGGNSFGYSSTITRQDTAVIINRLAESLNISLGGSTGEPFADHGDISGYARESVYALRSAGIVSGFEDGCFRPSASLGRAEAAKLVYELLKLRY